MLRIREFSIPTYSVSKMRWVAALFIALGLLLPFAGTGSGKWIWVAYIGGYARGEINPNVAFFFSWPLITAYCGTFFSSRVATWIRLVAEPLLLAVTTLFWIFIAFGLSIPAIGALVSGIGILLYCIAWVVDVWRRARVTR